MKKTYNYYIPFGFFYENNIFITFVYKTKFMNLIYFIKSKYKGHNSDKRKHEKGIPRIAYV